MAWFFLAMAGLFEIGWAVGLKYSDGMSKPIPTLLTGASMVISIAFLAAALRELPLAAAYAVWTGIGTVGTALFGIFYLAEAATELRLLAIGLIVVGIVLLKLAPAS
ncbi:DMT family transporter [Cognatishimia maritima]|uniref:Guanidinium exporter n=1 Tax=Cognatishimia maritima TaxID=870908 RepID=A0A1M5Q820_9RHOB|nr:multidrug efflux SMR transporter [Cognatishimia maritima]SHH10056.1 quaternary ammonium compound-resistance protein SugE [Cognatishimia maritima]